MQGTTGRLSVDPRALRRLPVPFQRVPHRAPVLRGRFHHHFLDLTLDQPRGEQPELARARAESPAFKLPVPLDFHVRDRHRHHCLVHVDSCDPIWHTPLLAGSGERAVMFLLRVTGCHTTTPTYSLKRARSGSSNMTASIPPLSRSTSPLAPPPFSQPGARFSSVFASWLSASAPRSNME